MKCIAVSEVRYVKEYQLWIRFNNGECGETDLKNVFFKCAAAAPLRDMKEFANFHLDEWPTVTWNCGFDLDPEYLYTLVTGKSHPQI